MWTTRSGWTQRLARAGLLAVMVGLWTGAGHANDRDTMKIGLLALEPADDHAPLSLLDTIVRDAGLQGARLGISDNNETGRFLGQEFLLVEEMLEHQADPVEGLERLAEQNVHWIITHLPAEALNTVLSHELAEQRTFFNAAAPDDALRGEQCRRNLFHVTPSRRMLADALAQFLAYKRWNRWALVYGNTDQDELLAGALRDSARRFGARVAGEKQWPHTAMARRADGGFHAIQREIPVFLQDLPEHDVLVIADETDYFGEYFPYQTRLPRPVAGTQGMRPTAWHRAHESWGAVQLHRRFEKQAERWMQPGDFAAWIAVRALGEAAARTSSVQPEEVLDYLRGDDFALGAYLGEPVSFRGWDQQLRQPVLVAGPRMVVSVSPQEGFLHPETPLDSLGHDRPESHCRF
ncbi:MAG: ABC transporter substrate-binding protein [Ectothiorhodospiraceae bacterium]|nr:ABC transporter substrate-binding protein [Ectothiorhodospiraceae bacterium]